MNRRAEVAVVGAGPAAWAVAAELAARGIDTVLAAPAPDAPWHPTYGCWADELDAAGLTEVAGRSFDRVTVAGGRVHDLAATYAVVDNARLHRRLRKRCAAVAVVAAGARRVADAGGRLELELTDGSTVAALAVIDATGHEPALVVRPLTRRPVPVQAAHGIVARFTRPPAEPGACTLMDWRPAPATGTGDPTFLYAFPLDDDDADGWWLVEETSLARSPSMSLGELERRLHRRLVAAGAEPVEVRAVERVAIPMGHPVPRPQAVLATGGAASLVHPATGYSLVASLQAAPRLAEAVAATLPGGRPAVIAAAGWDAVWPAERRRVRALQDYGLGVLLRLDAPGVAAFFDAFFELPTAQWRAYLDPGARLVAVTAVMRELFLEAPWALRARLATGDPRRLLAALIRG